MNETEWPDNAPSPADHPYLGFTLNTSVVVIRERFRDRFGVEPEYIVEHLGYLWAGPAPNTELQTTSSMEANYRHEPA